MEKAKRIFGYGKLSLILVSVIILFFILRWKGFLCDETNILRYFGYTITFIMLLVAIDQLRLTSISFFNNSEQFKKSNIWQKREKGLEVSWRIKPRIAKYRKVLVHEFNYSHRKDEEHAITVKEIHDKICEKNTDGNFIPDEYHKYKMTDKGKEIRSNLVNYLDAYEYLASGINHGIFDKEVVLNLFRGSILKAYKVLSAYVKHVNKDMFPEHNGKIWENFRDLGEELIKAEPKPESPKKV